MVGYPAITPFRRVLSELPVIHPQFEFAREAFLEIERCRLRSCQLIPLAFRVRFLEDDLVWRPVGQALRVHFRIVGLEFH